MNQTPGPLNIHRQILAFLDEDRSFAIALVLDTDGSTACKAGAKAIIDETGKIWGTVGGGAVEAETQRRAVEACQRGCPVVFDFDLTNTYPEEPQPICGGTMRLLVDPNPVRHRDTYAQALQALERRERGALLTTVEEGQVTVQWQSEDQLPNDLRACLSTETPCFNQNAAGEVLVEPVLPRPCLLIVGGGHIGQALAAQAVLVGFEVTVIDYRPEFTEPQLFPEGVATQCGPIRDLVAAFPIDTDTYIVIVTSGHTLDAQALEACINTPAAYIGMIGSQRKVSALRKHLIESQNATTGQFDRIFAPIGLDIGAQTVPEIAAAITAQLIAVRRKSPGTC